MRQILSFLLPFGLAGGAAGEVWLATGSTNLAGAALMALLAVITAIDRIYEKMEKEGRRQDEEE